MSVERSEEIKAAQHITEDFIAIQHTSEISDIQSDDSKIITKRLLVYINMTSLKCNHSPCVITNSELTW